MLGKFNPRPLDLGPNTLTTQPRTPLMSLCHHDAIPCILAMVIVLLLEVTGVTLCFSHYVVAALVYGVCYVVFQSLRSGSTGVWCVLRPDMLTIGWVGDSQIMLVRDGEPECIMEPHKPEREVSQYQH